MSFIQIAMDSNFKPSTSVAASTLSNTWSYQVSSELWIGRAEGFSSRVKKSLDEQTEVVPCRIMRYRP